MSEGGLLSYFVPASLGGKGGDFRTFATIAAVLGEGCLSTALIWAMHGQQTVVLADHAPSQCQSLLASLGREGFLISSVTSEYQKGGYLLSAESPLIKTDNSLRVQREAPIVSYGAHASYYLLTMRASENAASQDVNIVVLPRDDGSSCVTGKWNAMGMRGTQSVPMTFDAVVNADCIIEEPFRHIALQTMIPAGHVGWVACWMGAARGAFNRFVRHARHMSARGRIKLDSDLFITRLARLRVSLDLLDALLYRVAERLDRMRAQGASLREYEDIGHNILINDLKVAGSDLAFSVIDGLIELAGLSQGYMVDSDLGLERVFRDLRSAALMYNNDRLLQANGKLILVEHSRISTLWQEQR